MFQIFKANFVYQNCEVGTLIEDGNAELMRCFFHEDGTLMKGGNLRGLSKICETVHPFYSSKFKGMLNPSALVISEFNAALSTRSLREILGARSTGPHFYINSSGPSYHGDRMRKTCHSDSLAKFNLDFGLSIGFNRISSHIIRSIPVSRYGFES
ncbi:hypothetical protein HYALB_00005861 [Hymenoscyphus albidus]|uniref:Uncharacterized protein n=1 Tax=Hymenoscyphus albidus TaxID=595503 RepID=A0A9N9LYX2_9HELO|nr:hypothetical protein HYALB_00005861 [Hymenoscyphus albidus]